MKRHFRATVAMALVLIASIIGNLAPSASAMSSQRYAYSVGVNHAADSDLSGDFTGNVYYAATCYGMIGDVRAFYQYDPTVAYLRTETNPNGVRKLASDIVFLNGHGNYNVMQFGNSRGSGIYYGADIDSADYQYAGLQSVSSMSTVDLIAFVGCKTAQTSTNLASVARSKGATTSIGFIESINSRNTYGPEWLVEFHDYLANGYTVQQSIDYATAEYPGSNLGTYIKVYGSTSNTIAGGSSARSLSTNYDDIVIELDGLENCSTVPIETCGISGINDLVAEIQTMYSFDPEDYKVTVNMYSDDGQTGLIVLTYYVGDVIETDRAFVISVEDNIATCIVPSRSARTETTTLSVNETLTEREMLQKVELFETQKASRTSIVPTSINEAGVTLQDSDELVETVCRYYYDYTQNTLTYSETYFYQTSDPMSAFVDSQAIWNLA